MSAHELDHVAFAVSDWRAAGEMLHQELGARWASGFKMPAFSPCQLALAADMRLELLEPGTEQKSFVQRFLHENNGNAAPHHITFKVHDIHAAIAGAQAEGIEPVLVNVAHPLWQEAFLHPRDTGFGFLTQLVQTPQSIEEITENNNDFNSSCPWEETEKPRSQLPVVFGQVGDLERAAHVLRTVLGAADYPLPGEPAAKGFHWAEGADLILQETTTPTGKAGILALGVVPASEHWDGPLSPGLVELLQAGSHHAELGIRISPLPAAVPVTTG
ncbi:VOC family protein [Pseudarthrobacter sp. IC2-21]|jgi:methylmalonyl-CoA/ethylmalonyl-CoA epimerase|uniref:VOC family protein n=1 Tax=Pseudarthrobacter sp. IC2-21 TaxID=3092262 RepID=UPI002A6A46E5|nr:VOC family protein [Pseudarthrobacter sp. IC2-21]